jgi:hypothetical protein
VVDGAFDQLFGEVGATTLRRHHAGFALVAFDRVLVERRLALRDARAPGAFVAGLRRAADALRMTGAAHRLVGRQSVGRQRERGRHRGACGRANRQRRIVLPGDGYSRTADALIDLLEILGIDELVAALRVLSDRPRESEDQDRDQHQDAEHQTENVEEL